MAKITLSSDVILDVLKFVPYENATKLVQMSKSWVKPLQVQLKEQRIAIITEIRRLESTDLAEEYREYNSTYQRLEKNETQLYANFKKSITGAYSTSKQKDAIDLFNQRLQTIQTNKNAARIQYRASARKRQPVIDKILRLESKFDQCGKSESERFADLERRKKRYSIAMDVTEIFGILVPLFSIVVILGLFCHAKLLPSFYILFLSIASGIGLVVVLPLSVFTYKKLNVAHDKVQLKASRYENKQFLN